MTSPVLALASNNLGKLAELRYLIGDGVTLVSLSDLSLTSPEETGATFEANAELKARYVQAATGHVSLADDSGLVVDALDGEPGVYSARYAGEGATDEENRRLLLERLASVPEGQRTARFRCAIAIVDTDGLVHLVDGTCEGEIAQEERGANGFGYDPVFLLPSGQTMAEIEPLVKNRISHRAAAMGRARPILQRLLESSQS